MNNFPKLDNETFEEYCHRMGSEIKLEYGLSWEDISKIINKNCNLNYSETYYRRKEKAYKFKNTIIDDEKFEDYINTKKLDVKLLDEKSQINALIRRINREETIKQIAIEAVDKIGKKNLLPSNNIKENLDSIKSEGLLLISDWHYGLCINNNLNIYNEDICKDRINLLANKVIEKLKFHNINTLNIANLGDMISGSIHLPIRLNSRIDTITQVMEISEILCEFIFKLAKHFKIKYYSVIDNHSRLDPKKSDSLDLESLCRIIDWYVKKRLPYIEFDYNSFGNDICITSILDNNIAFVHGHKDKQSNIINRLNNFTKNHFDMICYAHYHHFSADEENDTLLVANGSLMGTDDFAYNLRLNTKASQNLIIVSEYNPCECIYKLVLNQ